MPHVELSLSEAPPATRSRSSRVSEPETSLRRWAAAAVDADEPCLVLDANAVIMAASASGAALIGLGDPDQAHGQPLRAATDKLVDFTAAQQALDDTEASKIPPLLAISSGRIARGLIRLECRSSGVATTLDAVTTPLTDGGAVVGSLTFFARV